MDKSIDLTFIKEFSGGKPERVNKYINMFLQQAPILLDQIKNNHESQNWADLKIAAHSLKPQLKYMGIKELEDTVLSIEHNSANEINLNELPQLIEKLDNVCQKAFEELKAEL